MLLEEQLSSSSCSSVVHLYHFTCFSGTKVQIVTVCRVMEVLYPLGIYIVIGMYHATISGYEHPKLQVLTYSLYPYKSTNVPRYYFGI